jgi:hypothetical protein
MKLMATRPERATTPRTEKKAYPLWVWVVMAFCVCLIGGAIGMRLPHSKMPKLEAKEGLEAMYKIIEPCFSNMTSVSICLDQKSIKQLSAIIETTSHTHYVNLDDIHVDDAGLGFWRPTSMLHVVAQVLERFVTTGSYNTTVLEEFKARLEHHPQLRHRLYGDMDKEWEKEHQNDTFLTLVSSITNANNLYRTGAERYVNHVLASPATVKTVKFAKYMFREENIREVEEDQKYILLLKRATVKEKDILLGVISESCQTIFDLNQFAARFKDELKGIGEKSPVVFANWFMNLRIFFDLEPEILSAVIKANPSNQAMIDFFVYNHKKINKQDAQLILEHLNLMQEVSPSVRQMMVSLQSLLKSK